MKSNKWDSTTKHELIIEVWEALDCESVGARELEEIQKAVSEQFGAGAVDSPASIARVVADEGAVLRHPEVFEYDLKWRHKQLSAVPFSHDFDFSGFEEAKQSIADLDELRCRFEEADDGAGVRRIRDLTLKIKQDLLLRARSQVLDKQKKLAAAEVAQWLSVWLLQPEVFQDWLELRRRSPEFQKLTQK